MVRSRLPPYYLFSFFWNIKISPHHSNIICSFLHPFFFSFFCLYFIDVVIFNFTLQVLRVLHG